MDSYDTLRHFADSWGLLAMTLSFLGVVLFALRPGARPAHADSAGIPFRNEDRPALAHPALAYPALADPVRAPAAGGCTGCGDCAGRCNDIATKLEP
jgi:cytochrome c oxidase cbb3-type subunit 4